MSRPVHNYAAWLRGSSRHALALAICAAASAVAAPSPIAQREAPTPVVSVTSEQLGRLPANRDLLAILNYHNQLRAEVGAPPLRWNPDLAAGAAAYGAVLSQGGTIRHASREGRKTIRENLSQSPRGSLSPLSMVQRWGSEKRNFRAGKFPDVSTDGNVDGILHYSQMIWPTTSDLGCAIHSDRSFDWVICRYSPPGNKDGVVVGPTQTRVAQTPTGGLCTSPRGVTIPCQNAPGGGVQEDGGGTVDDGGGDNDSGVKAEVVCAVDVNVHKPISVADDEPVIAQEEEVTKGAITLRNDDSDWKLGGEGGTGILPIISLPTDVDRAQPNPEENDLVKVVGINPGLTDVYLFAFPTHAEVNLEHKTPVDPVTDGEHADANELAYFQAAAKAGPTGLPMLIPPGPPTTLWVEAKLGGRYRMVIGKLVAGIPPGDVRYDSKDGVAYIKKTKQPAFVCEDQATITAAVVDIFQMHRNDNAVRRTAFDVYWGGRPHFRAMVWPGANRFSWGDPYKLGTTVHQMRGAAVDGEVASMKPGDEDVEDDPNANQNGEEVDPTGTAGGNFREKGKIDGGFQIHTDPGVAPGTTPTVNVDRNDRYPDRVSLGYNVDGVQLVRAEYLEVILPRVVPAAPAAPVIGTARVVESKVQYSIKDAFDRDIKAANVRDYLHFYGAGVKAWEALDEQPGRVEERGPSKDEVFITATGVDNRANARPPVGPLGTAQRSQALVRDNRMTAGTFQDTLVFTTPDDADRREALWKSATGRQTEESLQQARDEAKARDNALNRRPDRTKPVNERQADVKRRYDAVPGADRGRLANFAVAAIPQDVIVQLRVGALRHDLLVFQGNVLSILAPYFFDTTLYLGNKNDPVSRYHMGFAPGRSASTLVGKDYLRN